VVHVRDPGIAPPSLARVSEIAVGMYRAAAYATLDRVEVWVDDMRLVGAVREAGAAASLEARINAGGVVDVAVQLSHRDDRFRQLGEQPSYVTDQTARITSAVRLDALLPASAGIAAPLRLEFAQTANDPFYLRQTDIPTSALTAPRRPGAGLVSYRLEIRRTSTGGSAFERLLLDPLSVAVSRDRARTGAELSRANATNSQVRVEYDYRPATRPSGGTGTWWTPQHVYIRSHLVRRDEDRYTFRAAIALVGDSTAALASPGRLWRNQAGLDLRPVQPLALRIDYSSLRDFRHYGDSTETGRLLDAERGRILGADAGFERERTWSTGVSFTPAVGVWLMPRLNVGSAFGFTRDPNVRAGALLPDSLGGLRLPLAATNNQRREVGARVDPARLWPEGSGGALPALMRAMQSADFAYVRERRSSFDRVPAMPGLSYQFGTGSFEGFRAQFEALAAAAGETDTWTAAGGLALPLGGRVRLTYRDVDGSTWVRRGSGQLRIQQTSREWPSIVAAWTYRFGGTPLGPLQSVDARLQHRDLRNATRQEQGAVAGVVSTEQRTRTWTPSLQFTWSGGATSGAQYHRSETVQLAAGSETRSTREDWGGNIALSVRLPAQRVRLQGPLRATFAATGSDVRVCVARLGTVGCAPIADSRRRQVDVRLDSGFSPAVVGGASFSYILTDQRHLSSRFSQIVFTVFADVNFVTGRLP
jgi:hypothetical protein